MVGPASVLNQNSQNFCDGKVERARYLREEADKGNCEARVQLAYCYLTGDGVPILYEEAAKLFEMSANDFFNSGQFQLALELYEQEIAAQEKIIGEADVAKGAILCNIAACLTHLCKLEMALERRRQAHGLLKDNQQVYLMNLKCMANILGHLGKNREALTVFQDIRAILKKSDDSSKGYEIAEILKDIGVVYMRLKLFAESRGYFSDAHQLLTSLNCSESHPVMAMLLSSEASLLYELNDFNEALKYCQQALTRQREIYGTDSNLAEAETLKTLGTILIQFSRFEEALSYLSEALRMQKEIYGSFSHPEIGDTLNNLAIVLNQLGRFEDSLNYFQEALKYDVNEEKKAKTVTNIGTNLRQLGNGQQSLEYVMQSSEEIQNSETGRALLSLGRFEEALSKLEKDLEQKRKIYGTDAHSSIAIGLCNISFTLQSLGRPEEALKMARKAFETANQVYGDIVHPVKASILQNIGSNLSHLCQFEESLESFQTALKMRRQIYGATVHCDLAISFQSVGQALIRLGRYEEAFEYCEEALKLPIKFSKPLIEFAFLNDAKSICFGLLGKFNNALELQNIAFNMFKNLCGEEHFFTAGCLNHIGVCLYSLGEFEKALARYDRALEIYLKIGVKDSGENANAMSNKARCLEALGKIDEALGLQTQALSVNTKLYGQDHLQIAIDYSNMGSFFFSLKNYEQAHTYYKQCLSIREKYFDQKHPLIILTHTCIDTCLYAMGQIDNHVEEMEPSQGFLSKDHFEELITYAMSYLQEKAIIMEKNPSGFVRIRIPVPKDFAFADKIETLRLHYWPPELKIDTVEALHNHPRYFESMILNKGYTHKICKENKAPSALEFFRVHRIVKSATTRNPDERNMFCLGTANLEYVTTTTVEENTVVRFPRSLIHQVIEYQATTLTINAVFKSEHNLNYFNIYMPGESHLDPQREREFLTSDESSAILAEIKKILSNKKFK